MKMRVFLGPLSVTAFLLSWSLATSYNIVCYFSSWAIYRPSEGKFDVPNIDAHLCTHIIFAFIGSTDDGTLNILDPWESNDADEGGHYEGFRNLRKLKSENPNLKVLLSLGSWKEGSKNISIVAADPIKRKKLGWEALTLIEVYNFDGVDIYWEYANLENDTESEDKKNFVELLKDFKSMYQPRGLLVTAAVAGIIDKIELYNVKEVTENLDMMNVLSFDYHGAFDNFVGHVSPLHASSKDYDHGRNSTYTVATSIEYWLYKNADPKKINMGVVTYGRSFKLKEKSNTELYAPIIGAGSKGPYTEISGFLGYNEICSINSTYYWDDEQKVPHRVWGDQWVGFEDEDSLKLKVDFTVLWNLSGIMIWSLDTDDFLGNCGGGKYPLISTIKNRLNYHEDSLKGR
ncbi:acidic mammalian chitinase-like [Diorhabda sublineata]|uniref:acidic mammalian chitinase-like n=1 Tax=Diorhabda sublineata TaxID=1163346 RepID=UPI0024E14789|nr:acidic mammalian chitinase-like [Diorhabda sublineata]